MVTVSLRLEDDVKRELDDMCSEMGMNLTTFFMIYAKKALRDRKIPFSIEAPAEPFYSAKNMAWIAEADRQANEGKIVVKTIGELEAMADE